MTHPGLKPTAHGVSAALFSLHAEAVELCLFSDDLSTECDRFNLSRGHNGWWHTERLGLPDSFAYGFRVHGPYAPERGHRFNANKLLIDPYATALTGSLIEDEALYGFTDFETGAGFSERDSAPFVPKCWFDRATTADRVWQRPRTRWQDTILYEAHLKGFSAKAPFISEEIRGTYSAYHDGRLARVLKDFGVTAVEFLPLMTFGDERHLKPLELTNYWGYNPYCFFVPSDRYCARSPVGTPRPLDPAGAARDVRDMVQRFHEEGLEVFLDVVFNHTAESDHLGPTLSFRGIDNATYYHLDPSNPARYLNPTGTGNALNAGVPVVQRLVLDALAHWHLNLGMDGFRFDLASTLLRGDGGVMANASTSLVRKIEADPRLAGAKLIAEPWDMGSEGYQLGRFGGRWAEWNDQFRDRARALWHPHSQHGALRAFADNVLGSAQTFDAPLQSINFITAHDGFTLLDLVSYDHKHNQLNGEGNRDGHNHNLSWNHGKEGPTKTPGIVAERDKTRRALMLTLLLSQGVPMVSMGDERGRTQGGNNNAYCQDNTLTWMEWEQGESSFHDFVQNAVLTVSRLPLLRQSLHAHRPDQVQWFTLEGLVMSATDWESDGLSGLYLHLKARKLDEADLVIAINIGPLKRNLCLPKGDWSLALTSDGAANLGCLPARCVCLYQQVLGRKQESTP